MEYGICLTSEANFNKTNISCVGPWCTYRYFPEDTTYAVLFRETVSRNYQV